MDFIEAVEAAKAGFYVGRPDQDKTIYMNFDLIFTNVQDDSVAELHYFDFLADDWEILTPTTDFEHALDALFSGKRIGRIAWLSEPPANVAYGYKAGESKFEVYSDICDDSRYDFLYNMTLSSVDIAAEDWVVYNENWKVITDQCIS